LFNEKKTFIFTAMNEKNINKSIDEMNTSLDIDLAKIKERWAGKGDMEEYFKNRNKEFLGELKKEVKK